MILTEISSGRKRIQSHRVRVTVDKYARALLTQNPAVRLAVQMMGTRKNVVWAF